MSTVTIQERKSTSIKKAITPIIKESFPVLQMTCASCAISVESMLKAIEGVTDAGVNFANQSAWVQYDPTVATPEGFQKAVRSIGYDLIINLENAAEQKSLADQNKYVALKRRSIWSVTLSIPIVIIGMFFMNLPYANWIMMTLSTPVVFYFGRPFFTNAYRQASHGKANMDTLVALSTGIAWLFSSYNTINPGFWMDRGMHPHVYFEAASVVVAFISLGKLLEENAKSNTTSAIKKLIGLQPKSVLQITQEGNTIEVPIAQVKVNDVLLVKPGEKIPLDGLIIYGESYVDESMINGEPLPIHKKSDDKVFAGTINQKGSFRLSVEKVSTETLLAQIIKTVQEAQGSKAPVQQLVDKIAGIFVPVVILISLLTFTLWMILGSANAFPHALLASITVLVIACPCALGLATPTAIMVGVGKGAENNILIKDAESLEMANKITDVVLDKTGTITEGHPVVVELKWIDKYSDQLTLESILYALERNSEHPLAEAVVNFYKSSANNNIQLDGFESITGNGVRANFQQATYSVGNARMMQNQGVVISATVKDYASILERGANTIIFFAKDTQLLSVITIADKIKDSSAHAIEALINGGIAVYMVTGDNDRTAAAVAGKVGITSFQASAMPDDKRKFIQQLQQSGRVVGMVGDGINDSPALAQSDVSIAMGKGTDIAMEVAKITLLTSDLVAISKVIKLSGRTVRTIKQNLFWAFIYNVVGIPIAAGILYPFYGFLLDPMIAGAAMALSSFSVVMNSLRLKSMKL